MTDIVSADLSKFGIRELIEAQELLKAYTEQGAEFLGDGLTLNFNPDSGYVFLCDEDFNVGILDDDGKLVQFFSCPQCGKEGTEANYPFSKFEGYCSKKCQKENE